MGFGIETKSSGKKTLGLMDRMKYLALVPARGGSKGVKNKNIRLVNGVPLIHYTIKSALAVQAFSEVVVSTDSEEIAKVSSEAGALIPFIRPPELANDTAKSIDAVIHALDVLENEYDAVCLLQPTSPLRISEDILGALVAFEQSGKDSLVSVTKLEDPHPHKVKKIVDGRLASFLDGTSSEVPRQSLPECYILNGSIYLAKVDFLRKNRTFFSNDTAPYIIPEQRSINIDCENDLLLAEILIQKQKNAI